MTPRWLGWLNQSQKQALTPVRQIDDEPLPITSERTELYRPFTIWSEKIYGCGEDALPVILISEDRKFGMAAVFDGLGGSGAGRIELPSGNFTGAKLAASIGRRSLLETVRRIWLETSRTTDPPTVSAPEPLSNRESVTSQGALAESKKEGKRQSTEFEKRSADLHSGCQNFIALSDAIGACFTFAPTPNPPLDAFDSAILSRSFDLSFSDAMLRVGLHASNSRIKSRTRRSLPTTFAGAFFSESEEIISLKVFWAGDSRVYFLCSRGLFQLSIDHARAASTGLPDLSGDAPMTRMLSEQTPNEVESYSVLQISEPGFLIACTDGAYGYFTTGVHFELALWAALEKPTPTEQAAALMASIGQVTQDDASVAIVPVGFNAPSRAATNEQQSRLNYLHQKFEKEVSTLKELKPQVATLEENIEQLRRDMQALPRTMLGGNGGSLR